MSTKATKSTTPKKVQEASEAVKAAEAAEAAKVEKAEKAKADKAAKAKAAREAAKAAKAEAAKAQADKDKADKETEEAGQEEANVPNGKDEVTNSPETPKGSKKTEKPKKTRSPGNGVIKPADPNRLIKDVTHATNMKNVVRYFNMIGDMKDLKKQLFTTQALEVASLNGDSLPYELELKEGEPKPKGTPVDHAKVKSYFTAYADTRKGRVAVEDLYKALEKLSDALDKAKVDYNITTYLPAHLVGKIETFKDYREEVIRIIKGLRDQASVKATISDQVILALIFVRFTVIFGQRYLKKLDGTPLFDEKANYHQIREQLPTFLGLATYLQTPMTSEEGGPKSGKKPFDPEDFNEAKRIVKLKLAAWDAAQSNNNNNNDDMDEEKEKLVKPEIPSSPAPASPEEVKEPAKEKAKGKRKAEKSLEQGNKAPKPTKESTPAPAKQVTFEETKSDSKKKKTAPEKANSNSKPKPAPPAKATDEAPASSVQAESSTPAAPSKAALLSDPDGIFACNYSTDDGQGGVKVIPVWQCFVVLRNVNGVSCLVSIVLDAKPSKLVDIKFLQDHAVTYTVVDKKGESSKVILGNAFAGEAVPSSKAIGKDNGWVSIKTIHLGTTFSVASLKEFNQALAEGKILAPVDYNVKKCPISTQAITAKEYIPWDGKTIVTVADAEESEQEEVSADAE